MKTIKSIGIFLLLLLVLGLVEAITQFIILWLVMSNEQKTFVEIFFDNSFKGYLINTVAFMIFPIPISVLSIWISNASKDLRIIFKYAVIVYLTIVSLARVGQFMQRDDVYLIVYIVSAVYFIIISFLAFESEES